MCPRARLARSLRACLLLSQSLTPSPPTPPPSPSLSLRTGVPQTTVFETHTNKEISDIQWFKVDDLPGTRGSCSNFFLVIPFVRLIQSWIKCKRSGKHWHPARGDRSMSQSKQRSGDETPSKRDKEGKEGSYAPVLTPQPQPLEILKRSAQASSHGPAAGGAKQEVSRGNLTMGGDFKFDMRPIIASLNTH